MAVKRLFPSKEQKKSIMHVFHKVIGRQGKPYFSQLFKSRTLEQSIKPMRLNVETANF